VITRLLCGALVLLPARGLAQTGPRPISLPGRQFGIELVGPARSDGYADGYISVVGRRAALIRTETGAFEAWAWPLKLVQGFELRFKTPLEGAAIPGCDVARRVEISPACATIVYSHPAFTVRQRLFAPLDEPALVAVLEVDDVRPLEISALFRPEGLAGMSYAVPARTPRGVIELRLVLPGEKTSVDAMPRASGTARHEVTS
jgi:hypothetical protein